MSIYTSIFIAAFGIVFLYYFYGFRKGTGLLALIVGLCAANLWLEMQWPDYGNIIFLVSLLPLAAVLYITRSRPGQRKRRLRRTWPE